MTVGVVIRTLNESEHIARCLQTLADQHAPHELDVLVLDSGSTDDTIALARAHGARVHEMAPEDFDYSKSLNLGIELVEGELILILSAHAIPVNLDWVGHMTAPFEDPDVAGVASRQVPWPGAPFREVHRLAETFPEQRRVFRSGDDPLFSNAASCIRRSAWVDEPFTLPAAEDIDWGRRMVAAGRAIVYEPAAIVYHSHDESPRAVARRLIDISRGGTTSHLARTRRRTLREAAGLVFRDAKIIRSLDESRKRKLGHLRGLLQTAFYYVRDFSKTGSTAQLRRDG